MGMKTLIALHFHIILFQWFENVIKNVIMTDKLLFKVRPALNKEKNVRTGCVSFQSADIGQIYPIRNRWMVC